VRIPRDISGVDLAKKLRAFGYIEVRQKGSHIRLSSAAQGTEHHVTIPAHSPLKIGTLQAVLNDVAAYLKRDRSELIKELFG
jgi:predicted RNA binding protein YcfA (HicA-like mRNA interferase family)